MTLNFSRRGRKPKYEEKIRKLAHSVALLMAFFAAENENQQLKGLPPADFSGVPERFLLSVGTNSITENFVARLLLDMKFCYVGISRAFTILFNWIVTLVSRALSETPSFVSYLSISSTSKILFHWIVAFASRTLEGFSSIQLERWLNSNCNASIWN